jgi:hypothetical protein
MEKLTIRKRRKFPPAGYESVGTFKGSSHSLCLRNPLGTFKIQISGPS